MEWAEAQSRLRAPMFAQFRPALERLDPGRWPTRDDLEALAAGVRNAAGQAIAFVAPGEDTDARSYEMRIASTGEVPTRERNWHDVFNALAWIAWPRAKARLNAQHMAILAEGGEREARHRGPARDALTVFDEGGVVVASSDASLLDLLARREWKRLFWDERPAVTEHVRAYMFGHGTCEQALHPYIGMASKAVFVTVDAGFHEGDFALQLAVLDAAVAEHFGDRARFASPRLLQALPVLGFPGWYAPQDEAFYDNTQYFRSHPRRMAG